MGARKDTKLTITSCEAVHTGNNRNGNPYTIYEVMAMDEAGAPVTENLRAFDDLPLNELLDCEVERYESDAHGVTFTIYPKAKVARKAGGAPKGGLGKSVDELRERVNKLEAAHEELRSFIASGLNPDSKPEDVPGGAPTAPSAALADAPAGF